MSGFASIQFLIKSLSFGDLPLTELGLLDS